MGVVGTTTSHRPRVLTACSDLEQPLCPRCGVGVGAVHPTPPQTTHCRSTATRLGAAPTTHGRSSTAGDLASWGDKASTTQHGRHSTKCDCHGLQQKWGLHCIPSPAHPREGQPWCMDPIGETTHTHADAGLSEQMKRCKACWHGVRLGALAWQGLAEEVKSAKSASWWKRLTASHGSRRCRDGVHCRVPRSQQQ